MKDQELCQGKFHAIFVEDCRDVVSIVNKSITNNCYSTEAQKVLKDLEGAAALLKFTSAKNAIKDIDNALKSANFSKCKELIKILETVSGKNFLLQENCKEVEKDQEEKREITNDEKSMSELFAAEMECNSQKINDIVLEIEKSPQQSYTLLDDLMRATHSIKGAARSMNITNISNLAHAMEDFFSHHRSHEEAISTTNVDIILQCVDIFENFSNPHGDMYELSKNCENEISSIISTLSTAKSSEKIEKTLTKATPSIAKKSSNFIRIDLQKFNDIMGLAGQILVTMENLENLFSNRDNDISDIAELIHKEKIDTAKLHQELIETRMRPFGDGTSKFPRMVRDLSNSLGKLINFEISGKRTKVDRDILEALEMPLVHMIRNAVDHGIESPSDRELARKNRVGNIRLSSKHKDGLLLITLSDDGRGLNVDKIKTKIIDDGIADKDVVDTFSLQDLSRFLFAANFSTSDIVTEVSGRGVGLSTVDQMLKDVSGNIAVEPTQGHGITFDIKFPVTLSMIKALIVEISRKCYAFPLINIKRVCRCKNDEIVNVEGKDCIRIAGDIVPIVYGWKIFDLDDCNNGKMQNILNIVIVENLGDTYGIVVDKLCDQKNLVVKPIKESVGKIRNISSASILENGNIVLIINTKETIFSISNYMQNCGKKVEKILLIEDSTMMAEIEKKILMNMGYQVHVARDGLDGMIALRSFAYDLIVTDLEMPKIDGFSLIRNVRESQSRKIPIIVISSNDDDQSFQKAIEFGANFCISKKNLTKKIILKAIKKVLHS